MAAKKSNVPQNTEVNAGRLPSGTGGFGEGFAAQTLRNSFKTVFFNFKEYIYFFIALFIIQSVFWMLCFTTSGNINNEYKKITESYDYHILIEDMNKNEFELLEETLYTKSIQNSRAYFDRYEAIHPDEYNDYYSLKITLKDGADAEDFLDYYVNGMGVGVENIRYSLTPLATLSGSFAAANLKSGILAAAFFALLSMLVIMTLYNIRIRNFKFMYGVYMTCGAGFKKLFSVAVWEMMVISATTLIASFIFSSLVFLGIFLFSDVEMGIMLWMIPVVILLNFITVYFAVRAPMKHMANKTPLSLIVAGDNSDVVSSPRKSFVIFNKSFPYHYELFSAWRFRRYLAGTLVTAVVFTSLFVCGIYIASMNRMANEDMGAEVDITLDVGDIDLSGEDEFAFNIRDVMDIMDMTIEESLLAIDGVNYALWVNESAAGSVGSHIFIKKSNLDGGSVYGVSSENVPGYDFATNLVSYSALDKQYIDTLYKLYDIEGDPYAVLEDGGKIIISDTIYNEKRFDFKPGDKISVATFLYRRDKLSDLIYSDVDILREMLQKYAYEYKEYEVAAVVHGMKSEKYFTVGMNYDEYYSFTGSKKISQTLNVWLDDDLGAQRASEVVGRIKLDLREYLGEYMIDFFVSNNYAAMRSELVAQRQTYTFIVIISALLLLLSPVVWFFSQMMFYAKREKEMRLLRMFGADEKSMRRAYSTAGGIMAVLAMAVTVILSYAVCFAVYKLFNNILVAHGFVSAARYTFGLSPVAIAISLAVSVGSGFLSSFIPYSRSKRRHEKENKVAEVDSEALEKEIQEDL